MEPIQIHVSVELNLSQDVKNFLSSVVSNRVAAPASAAPAATKLAPAPAAPAAPTAPASAAPASAAPAATKLAPAPAAPAAPTAPASAAPASVAPAAPSVTKLDPAKYAAAPAAPAPQVTIEQVRQALAAKINGHREEIKEKLNSLGSPSVTKLDPAKYAEMFTFLKALS